MILTYSLFQIYGRYLSASLLLICILASTRVYTQEHPIDDKSDFLQRLKRIEILLEPPKDTVCSQEARFDTIYRHCPRGAPAPDDVDAMSDEDVNYYAKNLLVAEKLKTIVCLHFKVAWTSIKTILLNNTLPDAEAVAAMRDNDISWGNLRRNHNITQLNDPRYSIADRRHRLKHFFKFFFVRHPFDRIYSGYKDKLVKEMDDGHGEWYKHLVPKIAALLRPELLGQPPEDVRLPFRDVLSMVEAGGMDQHFIGPYFRKCRPCNIKYDYIGKVETFDVDMSNIIDRQFPARRGKNTRLNVATDGASGGTASNKPVYFRKRLRGYETLDREVFKSMVEYYASDFVNYGYSWQWDEGGRFYVKCNGTCC